VIVYWFAFITMLSFHFIFRSAAFLITSTLFHIISIFFMLASSYSLPYCLFRAPSPHIYPVTLPSNPRSSKHLLLS